MDELLIPHHLVLRVPQSGLFHSHEHDVASVNNHPGAQPLLGQFLHKIVRSKWPVQGSLVVFGLFAFAVVWVSGERQ